MTSTERPTPQHTPCPRLPSRRGLGALILEHRWAFALQLRIDADDHEVPVRFGNASLVDLVHGLVGGMLALHARAVEALIRKCENRAA